MDKYYVKLKALSPIHIGSGETYEPTNYVIDDGYLYEFDEILFYKGLSESDKKRFLEIIEKNRNDSLFELFIFIKHRKKLAKECAYRKVQISSGLQEYYNNNLGKITQKSDKKGIREFNQFIIEKSQILKNKNRLYIPGSSLKGAIITAYMEYLLKNDVNKYEYFINEKLSQELLLSDTIPLKTYEMIGYALNKEKFEEDMIGPKKFIEVIFSNHKNQSTFETTVSLKRYEQKFKYHIKIEELIKAINSHYYPLFKKMFQNEEIKKVLGKGFKENFSNLKLKDNQFILRVGKHSGAEAVTIDGVRKILVKIAQIQNKKEEKNNIDKRIQRLHKKSRFESDKLEDLVVDFGMLRGSEKEIFQMFDDFYYEPERLENLVRQRKKLTINAILKEATTMWVFGFNNKLEKNKHLPFGWVIGEVKEIH